MQKGYVIDMVTLIRDNAEGYRQFFPSKSVEHAPRGMLRVYLVS